MTTTNTTQAQKFFNNFSVLTENNGWTGTSLQRHPNADEANEMTGDEFSMSWGWEFNDGSKLFLVPGQMTDTVSVRSN